MQKRLGTALRHYKSSIKGKTLWDGKGGKGGLTDKMIDKMQNYYCKAIRNNTGDLQGMKDSIMAIKQHMIVNEQIPLEKQHQYCLRGKTTWCKFWKDKQSRTATYDESNRLPGVSMEELNPIFTRLSKDDLLRCLQGLTESESECEWPAVVPVSKDQVLWSEKSTHCFV